MQKIVTKEQIEQILVSYGIGKKPLSLLLGWGETTICRYLDGDVPSEKYSNVLLNILNDPNLYLELLEKNKANVTELAYTKSLRATKEYLSEAKSEFAEDKPMSGLIRVAASTIKITVADIDANKQEILKHIDAAFNKDVKLLVFNELCVTGYTCHDLFLQDLMLDKVEDAILDIAKYTKYKNIVVVIGAPLRKDEKLYNCAIVIHNGKILGVVPKINIPNYNEFYEVRHFVSGANIQSSDIDIGTFNVPFGTNLLFRDKLKKDFKFGIEICEDLWVAIPPSSYLAQAGATIIANLSASNEVIGKSEYRRDLVSNQSARLDCGYVYASAGDGESTQDLVFSGHNIIACEGRIIKETKLFDNKQIIGEIDLDQISHERQRKNTTILNNQNIQYVDFEQKIEDTILQQRLSRFPFVPHDEQKRNERCDQILTMQAYGLKKRIEHINCKTVVVGLSGGLDSALAILVAAKAMDILGRDRKDIIAITMPCFGTTKRTKSNAEILANALGTSFMDINISNSVKEHFKDINQSMDKLDVTFENGQARERTQVLMDIANKEGGIVIGTGDLSELALGWATYNGDHMSMYAVNASIPKTLVRYIVKYYADTCNNADISKSLYDILDTPVSPELLPAKDGEISQKTEDLVGPYELHDFFLYYIIRWGFEPKKVYAMAINTFKGIYAKETIYKWLRNFYWRFFTQQFKRSCLPDGPKVGSVVLSPRGDWRMPSDAKSSIWMKELDEIEV